MAAERTEGARISVVIPTLQAARFITEALESVVKQTVPIAQIIVVDDGSTDETLEISRAWAALSIVPTTVIPQQHVGAGAARRVGLAHAATELIAFLDADDRLLPDAYEHLLAVLDANPKALLCYGAARTFVDESLNGEEAATRFVVATGPAPLTSTSLIRRRAFGQVGDFGDDSFSSVEWFARVLEEGPGATISLNEIVAERRIHSANTSALEGQRNSAYARIIKRSLDRRREAGGAGS